MPKKPVIVIGAGIVGVSTALWLQNAGYEVILMDRQDPGEAASFGNAGLIAQWAVVPVNTPQLWKKLPGLIFDPDSALFMKWSYAPRLMPWLVQFLQNARETKTQRTIDALLPLLSDALEQHRSLTEGTPVERWIRDSKFNYIYPSQQDFDDDSYSWEKKRKAGFVPNIITGPAVREEEPMLGENINVMASLEGHGHILNPGQYVKELAKLFAQRGGRFIKAEVKDFEKSGSKISQVMTSAGQFECDKLVIASGIWSKPLMQRLGLNIPLETERGYHVMYKNPSQMPKNPMMAAGKFAITPMDEGLRCAGTVELGGIKLGPSKDPIRLIRNFVKKAFPNLTYETTEEWMGFRPSTPDSLPLIGQIRDTGIYTAFGHQHIGLTAGPKTGRMIADMISGKISNMDLSAYDPERF